MITKGLIDETVCPGNLCVNLLQVIKSKGINIEDVQQITTCTNIIGGDDEEDSGSEASDEKKQQRILTIAVASGAGLGVLMVGIGVFSLLFRGRKRK